MAAAVSAVEAAGAVTVAAAVPEFMQAKNRSTLIGLCATAQAILADTTLARAAQAARRAAPLLATRASVGETTGIHATSAATVSSTASASAAAAAASSSSLESVIHGVATDSLVRSPILRLARSVSALTAAPFAKPPRSICSIVGCGGGGGLPPIHSVSLHSRCRLVSRRNPRCAACTRFRSYLICCARSHLSRCRRLHPSKCSSDTELPCCLTHLRMSAFASSDLLSRSSLPVLPSRSCRTLATSTRSSLITPASWPVTLRARW